jgi:integrase
MTVRKRGESWFVDFWFNRPDGSKERVRKDSPVNTKRGADEFERQLRNELLDPTPRGKEILFEKFADEFQEVYGKANLKHATRITYASTIRYHLLPAFASHKLETITAQVIERFKAKLIAKGLSPATVRNTLGVLSRMVHVAKTWGYLREVPTFKLPRVPTPKFRFLSQEECAALLTAAGDYWGPPIYFALKTGCRQGELWAMEREQLDLANGVVHVDRAVYRGKVGLPKHDKIRTVDLSPRLVEFLREHLKVVPLRARLVFPTDDGTIRLERKAAVGLNRAAMRAGLKPFGWHVLRHTFASHLVMSGEPLQVVQQLLGHSRIDETMRYAHLSPAMKRNAVARLDGLIEENFGQQLGNGRRAQR